MNEKEKRVIGAILHNRSDAGYIMQELKPDYFTDNICRDVFECMNNGYILKQNILSPAQILQVMSETHGDISAVIDEIYNAGAFIDLENTETIAGILKREYLENRFRQQAQTADAETILKLAEGLVTELNAGKQKIPENVAEYLQTDFERELKELQESPVIKTGLQNFDAELGGLYAGLYVVGAISSLGKTTLIHQISDNIARAGIPVLYFSLEMSRLELITKSIARITAQNAIQAGHKGKELQEVCKASIYWRSHGIKTDAGKQALNAYSETIAPNLNILQGDFGTDVLTIRSDIQRFIRRNAGRKPVIVIDYLQIIKPADERKTAKDNVDYTVTELKRISRDFNIPVIVISSFNRGNYMLPVSFESFKESGGIEYTADVVIGLQLDILNDAVFEKPGTTIKTKRDMISKAKAESPRKIDMHVLKNRYGRAESRIVFEYTPQYDLFVPAKDISDTVFSVTDRTPKGYKPSKGTGNGFITDYSETELKEIKRK